MNWTRMITHAFFLTVAWMALSVWILCWALDVQFSNRLVIAAMVLSVYAWWLVASSTGLVMMIIAAFRKVEEAGKHEAIQRSAKNVLDQLEQHQQD